jgi:hypothetical protein
MKEPFGLGQDAGRECKILGPDIEPDEARIGARDRGDMEEGRCGLDHGDEPRRPRRDAALGFDFVEDFGDRPDMLGAVDLWQRQCLHPRPDRRFEVAHRQPPRPVDADDDIGAAARHDLGSFGNEFPRPRLFRLGDAVFEVEDDRVGAAPGGAADKTPGGDRHEQERAPDRQVWGR